jgi:hypothetical protein
MLVTYFTRRTTPAMLFSTRNPTPFKKTTDGSLNTLFSSWRRAFSAGRCTLQQPFLDKHKRFMVVVLVAVHNPLTVPYSLMTSSIVYYCVICGSTKRKEACVAHSEICIVVAVSIEVPFLEHKLVHDKSLSQLGSSRSLFRVCCCMSSTHD